MTTPDESSVIAAILAGIGAPDTQANAQSVADWIAIEQGGKWPPSASFNPMNTTLAEPGATSFNSVNVRNYTSWQQGIAATDQTLLSGYPAIVSAFKGGAGILNPSSAIQQELLKWSGNGYSSVAAGAATAGVTNLTSASSPLITSSQGIGSCFPNAIIILVLLPLLPIIVPLLWGTRAISNRVKQRRHISSRQRANRESPRKAH